MPGLTVRLLSPGNSSFLQPMLLELVNKDRNTRVYDALVRIHIRHSHMPPAKLLIDSNLRVERTHACCTLIGCDTDVGKMQEEARLTSFSLLYKTFIVLEL